MTGFDLAARRSGAIYEAELTRCLSEDDMQALQYEYGNVWVVFKSNKTTYCARAIFMFASFTVVSIDAPMLVSDEQHVAAVRAVVAKLRAAEPSTARRIGIVIGNCIALLFCFPCVCAWAVWRSKRRVSGDDDDYDMLNCANQSAIA